MVDALLLIAGGRGAGDIVRQGAERAEVAAGFSSLSAGALRWLEEQSIEHEGELILRRVLGADGRSRAYVNGQLVPLQSLRELADLLIEIHGQQEHQHLVKRSAQRELLDARLKPASTDAVADLYGRYRTCRAEFESLRAAAENRESRLELLRYQLVELQGEVTTPADIEALFAEQKRIAGRGRLAQAASGALSAVYDEESASAHDLLGKAAGTLRAVVEMDPQLRPAAQLLGEAAILVREAADSLRHYLDALDMDPARQEEIERKAAALEALARKHRQSVVELPAQLARTEEEIRSLEGAEQSLAECERTLAALERDYRDAAHRLTEARRRAALALGEEITALMQSLGMAGGRFAVSVEPAEEEFSAHGGDSIEFLVSANPGPAAQEPRQGGLGRGAFAHQPCRASRRSGRHGRALPGIRRGGHGDRRRGRGNRRAAAALARQPRSGSVRHASRASRRAGPRTVPRDQAHRRQGHAHGGQAAHARGAHR